MPTKVNWLEAIKPLFKKYKDKKHPLDYESTYPLWVMVVLSAHDSDRKNLTYRRKALLLIFMLYVWRRD